ARPARRQGRERRRDDADPRGRARARGLHDHDRGLRRLHARRPRAARGPLRPGRRRAGAAGGAGGQAPGRRRRPAARLRALGRARVDAGDVG
ncbi:MAG: Pyruvate,phosphate dikinase, partial [uncultured Solirubrobacteraceae bacterium]